MTGRFIGHYLILEKIGAGGMGEVFRARDERLGRDVALKIIKPALSDNSDHLRRFEQEARAAAALNHPNIVAVYDVGFDGGSPYIVTELLEGKTLRERLAEGGLSSRLAADYGLQIALGLIAAHDRRIVHRDLKPENIFVTNDGRVKILDFGVAKLQPAPEAEESSLDSLTTVTKSGSVIGTVAYMSPEQLRAKPVDHRSDIFSVGAILYEMLTTRRAFRGETQVDTMTAVLREDPPEIDLEQASVSPALQQILRHCLEKEPENRFQSTRDLAFALRTVSSTASGKVARLPTPRRRIASMVPWAVALLLAVALLIVGVKIRGEAPALAYTRLTFEQGTVYSARFSPDGHSVVYGAAWGGKPLQLYTTVGDSHVTQPLDLTGANLLAVSRSGELALVLHGAHTAHLDTENGTLARGPLVGGSPRKILEDVTSADWDAGTELAVVHHAEDGYRIEYPIGHVLYQSGGWISHIRFSPTADQIAFMDHPALWDNRGSICVMDLAGKRTILTSGWNSEEGLAWGPDGKEIWFTAVEDGRGRGLFAVNMRGRIRHLLDLPGIMLQDVLSDGRVLVSMNTERLAMATTARDGKAVDLSWHDWSVAKDISPDGESILFEDSGEAVGPRYEVAIRNINGDPPVRLGEGSAGGLSPDGKWAISLFTGTPERIALLPVGPGQPRDIPFSGLERIQNGTARFLPDGKGITVNGNEAGHGVRCYLLDLEGGKPRPITPEGITGGLVSPNGKYILESGGQAVALYPLAGGAPLLIQGLEEGFVPFQWSADSSAIYGFRHGEVPARIYRVEIATGHKTLVQELQPETGTGVVNVMPVVGTRDGSRYAYSYYQVFSVLYLISGVR